MALARKIAVQSYHRRGEGDMAMVTALYRSLLAVLAMATLGVAADVPPSSRLPEDQDLRAAAPRSHPPNPDMNVVFQHYREALRIAPQHRGAHEYIGEAYLMVGDLPRAKEHLAALDKLCFFTCAEYRDLKKEMEHYEKKP